MQDADITIRPREVMPDGATTLPAPFYVDAARFRREMDQLFAREWICAGRVEQVEGPGQFFVREVLGESIIITRSAAGAVQAFYNVCRHRGTKLCTASRRDFAGQHPMPVSRVDLRPRRPPDRRAAHGRGPALPQGRLPAAPRRGGRLGRAHLHHAREIPRPLADQLADLPGKFRSWRMEDLRLGHRIVYDVRANWKLIVQNYNECLHCPNLHPALNKLSHYLSGENEPLHPSYMGGRMDLRAGVETMSMDGSCPRQFLPDLTAAERRGIYYYAIFPNLLLSLHPDYMMVHTLWPLAPDRTINICEWHFHPAELARPGFDAADVIDFWDMTNRQDWGVCELSQAGISSRAYMPGPYSNREDLLYAFDRMIVNCTGDEAGCTDGGRRGRRPTTNWS